MNNKNKGILKELMKFDGCGTGTMIEIEKMGKEAYFIKEKERKLNIFNQLDKSTLPIDKITELEQIIREQAELQINQGNIEKSVENNTKFYLIIEELLTLTK